MVDTKPKVLVVVAAGPLIGVGVAALFAQKGFTHIALLSRNAERLQQDAKDGGLPVGSNKQGIIVKTYAADVTIPDSLNSALRKVEADFGAPEVVVYNGARVSLASLSNWDTWSEEDMVTDFRVSPWFHETLHAHTETNHFCADRHRWTLYHCQMGISAVGYSRQIFSADIHCYEWNGVQQP
jgi:NAD(P)-dependent dehydrogenase (short-subunit alcohol dehydrogenase family)